MNVSKSALATFSGNLSIVLGSTAALFTCYLKRIPANELLLLTFGVGYLFSIPFSKKNPSEKEEKLDWLTYVVGISGIFLYNFGYVTAFKFSPAAHVGLIAALWPIIALLLSPLVLKERYTLSSLFGCLFGVVALCSIVYGSSPSYNNLVGYGIALSAAAVWALYNDFFRLKKHTPIRLLRTFLLGSFLLSLITHLFTEAFIAPTAREWLFIAIVGISSQGAVYFLWDFGIKWGNFKWLKSTSYFGPILSMTWLIVLGQAHITADLVVAIASVLISCICSGTNVLPLISENMVLLKEKMAIEERPKMHHCLFEHRAELFTRELAEMIKQESRLIKIFTSSCVISPFLYFSIGIISGKPLVHFFDTKTFLSIFLLVFLGVFGRSLYRYQRRRYLHVLQDEFITISGKLFDLIFVARNTILDQANEKERPVYLASLFLEDPQASNDKIKFAVRILTEKEELVQSVQTMNLLYQAGLYHEMNREYRKIEDSLRETCIDLREISTRAIQLLRQRFEGTAESLKKGVRRQEGFIERTLYAGECGDYTLMTLEDAIEVYRLLLELLNDRAIDYLQPVFNHNKMLFDKGKKQQKRLHKIKSLVIKRNNLLRVMTDLFAQFEGIEIPLETYAMPAQELHHQFSSWLPILVQSIEAKITITNSSPTQRNVAQLKEMLQCLMQMKSLYAQLMKYHREAQKMAKQYQKHTQDENDSKKPIEWSFSKRQFKKRSIWITEKSVSLNSDQKRRVMKKMVAVIRDVFVKRQGRRIYFLNADDQLEFSHIHLKQLAVNLLCCLDSCVPLTYTVRSVIESSKGVNISSIEAQWGYKRLVGWFATQCYSMISPIKQSAHHLARVLVRIYGIHLNDQMISFLVNEYDAEENELKALNDHATFTSEQMNSKMGLNIELNLLPKLDFAIYSTMQQLDNVQGNLVKLAM